MLLGSEFELGIVPLSSKPVGVCEPAINLVGNYQRVLRSAGHRAKWNYLSETPLKSVFGDDILRDEADPSLLTDDAKSVLGRDDLDLLATNLVTKNGGRFYVDHAHPEYSTPECENPLALVMAEAALSQIAQEAMAANDRQYLLYQNLTDGKGNTWGYHENYQFSRQTDFQKLIVPLATFLVVRNLLCGAGKLGIGRKNDLPGFQISSRADFFESLSGVQTTYQRPIVNLRDEPHADRQKWRRLHVITGDANRLPFTAYLKFVGTSLFLWAWERQTLRGDDSEFQKLCLSDPVKVMPLVSRDLFGAKRYQMQSGKELSAVEILVGFSRIIGKELESVQHESDLPYLDAPAFFANWQETLQKFTQGGPQAVSDRVEWALKYSWLDAARQKFDTDWQDPKLAALEQSWADLRDEKSVYRRLEKAGLVAPLPTHEGVKTTPSIRAQRRAELVNDPRVESIGWRYVCYRGHGKSNCHEILCETAADEREEK
ncbi:hypothetical protein BK816_03965 [Boudabousia tangfeifanii]|uniref:Proteasome accessory factor PafA2 n=1 Tax=Boudabousia tangfeifanii TaxID=1912795 RepID=A0A1D9MJS1_9ACTO|nr:proteasome accessory factor PafA2 family protein [Boudabousia tangfeifanii]AOZ72555.1 hypothetical protein BK816_03965 [Boudabousia tangfeifanii]